MELTQLEYFLTVAKIQHMTKVAEALSISQPALSHAIAKLEHELGVHLFERKGRNVRLNRYGVLFAKQVEKVFQDLKQGKQQIEDELNPESGIVRITYLNILGADFVPSLVKDHRSHHPLSRFDFTQGGNEFIYDQLEAGYADLLLTSTEASSSKYEWRTIQTLPLYIVLPVNHRLSNREALSMSELRGESFIGLNTNSCLRERIITCFQHAGVHIPLTYEMDDLVAITGFVAAGLGISILPMIGGLKKLEGLRWIRIQEEGWDWTIGVQWNKDSYLSPAVHHFLQYLHDRG